MDHKSFVLTLSSNQRAALERTSDGPALRHLALHGGLIVLFALLIAVKIPLWPLLIPVLGILYIGLFTLQHECTHKTPFRSQALNEVAGWISGIILFQPFLWFRYFHLAHHRHTNDPDHDPELDGSGKPKTLAAYIFYLSTIDYWRSKISVLGRSGFGSMDADYLPGRVKPRLRREALIHIATYAVVAVFTIFVSPILIWTWLLPIILGFPFLRLYLLAEHGHCPPVADMFENTRTTFTNRIIRFLAWNMPYHAEHHACPNVPFHKLPELHGLCAKHLKSTSNSYTGFHRGYLNTLSTHRD
ncbi:MAG: fatty acid desaturase [Rhizobiaceae bacterium]